MFRITHFLCFGSTGITNSNKLKLNNYTVSLKIYPILYTFTRSMCICIECMKNNSIISPQTFFSLFTVT